jgi:hypothetical protein
MSLAEPNTVSRLSRCILALALLCAVAPLHAASPKKAFVKAWEHQHVVLKHTLFNLVYNERQRFVPLLRRDGRSAGLTVATPTETYYRFSARREDEQDVVDRDPARVLALLHDRYRRSTHLDVGTVQDIEAVQLVRFEPGMQFTIERVSVEHDEVRLDLRSLGENPSATTLTVKLSGPLSTDLTEAPMVEQVLGRFLAKR